MRGKIFINYRREGTAESAGRLYDRLAQAFGRKNLFVDFVGVDLRERVKNQLPMCQVLLTVIGPSWLDAKDEAGRRRIDNPDDFVAVEIVAAVAHNIPVIPVLVDGARMPQVSELPDSLQPLASRQAVEVRRLHFDRDAEAVVERVREALDNKAFGQARWRARPLAAAALAAVLILIGASTSIFVQHLLGQSVQQAAERRAAEAQTNRKAEEAGRQARAAAEAEINRKVEEVEKQPLAAEQERQARAAAEAEANRKAEETEKRRLTAEQERRARAAEAAEAREAEIKRLAVEQERRARAAEAAEANRKVEEAEKQQLAVQQERQARVAAEAEAKRKSEDAEQQRLAVEQERQARVAADAETKGKSEDAEPLPVAALGTEQEARKRAEAETQARYAALISQGNIDANAGVYDKAIADYNDAIKLDPKNILAFIGRGDAYTNKGDYDRALANYNEAIRLDPKSALAVSDRGVAYANKGDLRRGPRRSQ